MSDTHTNAAPEPAPSTEEMLELVATEMNRISPEEAIERLANLDTYLEAVGAVGYEWSGRVRRFLALSYLLRGRGETFPVPVPGPR